MSNRQETALITGASSGLGAEFARALAARGNALILTARRADRMEALAAELRERHGIAVTVIPADLSRSDAVEGLIAAIAERGLAVDILINNAGFGLHGAFVDHDPGALADMIDLNCRALTQLCRALLPGMVQMRRGAILNVASVASFAPGPQMAVYYATKAYVLSLSEALHEEVRDRGVRVVALCPGPTRTEFGAVSGIGDTRLFRGFASDMAPVIRAGLRALDRNRAIALPGLGNRVAAFGTRLAPRWLMRRAVGALQQRRR